MELTPQLLSGQIVDVVNRRIFPGTLAIRNGRIVSVSENPHAPAHFILPGFVDAHIHVESSMLVPTEFARLAVRHGTVATVSDPHEIANVLGVEGVRFMIRNAAHTPFHFCFGAPSCVPATAFETAGAVIDSAQVADMLDWPEIGYLAEMMNYPGVLSGDPEVMAKIRAAQARNKPVDGHAPGLRGEEATRYIRAGISTDHECVHADEARGKLQEGMKILIREGSAAKNFDALIPLLPEYPDDIMFCTDDSHPNTLRDGHINALARRAVAAGYDPMQVIRACTLNPVKHYRLGCGLLQEGDYADCCIVNDLRSFDVQATYLRGQLAALSGQSLLSPHESRPVNRFERTAIRETDLQVRAAGGRMKVIEVEDGQLITRAADAPVKSVEGRAESNVETDVLKLVVASRYDQSPPAVAFIRNIGLRRGAIASSVAHDSHNLIACGVSDDEITRALNLVISSKGGIAWCDGERSGILPLPYAGLMSGSDGLEIAAAYDELLARARDLGTALHDPFMTLSFCALLVIPELKLSDRGLFDTRIFGFVPVFHG